MPPQQWNPLCHIGRSATQFRDPATSAALWAHSGVDGHGVSGINRNRCCVVPRKGEIEMMKFVIAAGLTVAMVAAASAADMPRPQPVYQTAPVGKAPIGKSPIGKSPVGKAPIAARY
jgi:hypothetical protein